MAIITDPAILRLLQLASPTLPVGGYAFSQGMEYAIEAGWLRNRDDVRHWLEQQLELSLACIDLPLVRRLHKASMALDEESLRYFNSYALACRETAELRLTDSAMGSALARLLNDLDATLPVIDGDVSFATAFAWAAARWGIDVEAACQGYLWSWLENQVAAATKLVPLGQTAAQQLLSELLPELSRVQAISNEISEADIGGTLPGLAAASCRHESQYSRLFRS